MTCIDCHKPLTDQEEYYVILSIEKIPRCKRCYGMHMNKLRQKYAQQKGATV
jgi:NAD-dependent SIR2 family protein deacetylase